MKKLPEKFVSIKYWIEKCKASFQVEEELISWLARCAYKQQLLIDCVGELQEKFSKEHEYITTQVCNTDKPLAEGRSLANRIAALEVHAFTHKNGEEAEEQSERACWTCRFSCLPDSAHAVECLESCRADKYCNWKGKGGKDEIG